MVEWILNEIKEKEIILEKLNETGYLELVNEAGMKLTGL